MRQQEAELAQLELEAESTRLKIAEARRRAEETPSRAAAAAAREAARVQKAEKEARIEEARRELQREQAARASALAAEAAKLAAAQALAEAREQEHKIVVLAAKALKEEHDREQSLLAAARAAAEQIAHRDQVLAAKREENARLAAELETATKTAQEAASRESGGLHHDLLRDKETRRQRQAEGLERQRLLSLQRALNFTTPPSTGPSPSSTPTPHSAPAHSAHTAHNNCSGPSVHSVHSANITHSAPVYPSWEPPSSSDRDMSPRRRSAELHRQRRGLSPLGRAHYTEGAMQAHKKAQRVSEDTTRREAARSSAVEDRRAKSPILGPRILGPDLYAMLGAADAARATVGLPAHTMESFLLYLHNQVTTPQAAHQNAAPQDPTEDDLRSAPSRSQGAPAEGHCQMGGQ